MKYKLTRDTFNIKIKVHNITLATSHSHRRPMFTRRGRHTVCTVTNPLVFAWN